MKIEFKWSDLKPGTFILDRPFMNHEYDHYIFLGMIPCHDQNRKFKIVTLSNRGNVDVSLAHFEFDSWWRAEHVKEPF